MLRSPQPTMVVELLPELVENLIPLLSELPAEEWTRPTACAGWSVKDVALHVLGIEMGSLSRRRDGHRWGPCYEGWEEVVAGVNEWNEQWLAVARRISCKLLVDMLSLAGRQACDYYRSLDLYALGGPVIWVGPEPVPVWLDVAREYTERWHHQQHIRDATGRPGLKEPRYLAPVLATFAWAMPRAMRGASGPEGTVVTLTVTGESAGKWSVRREGRAWKLYEGSTARPDTEVVLDEDCAWRLFTRGMSEDQARQQAKIVGDVALGNRLLDMVSIIA
jgi:uncharacterized protein (TIGR03083 family)